MLKILLDVTKGESHEDTRGVLCQSMCEISQIAYESGGIVPLVGLDLIHH